MKHRGLRPDVHRADKETVGPPALLRSPGTTRTIRNASAALETDAWRTIICLCVLWRRERDRRRERGERRKRVPRPGCRVRNMQHAC